jgi:hypothetical protein
MELRAHHPHQAHPAEEQQQAEQPPEAGRHHAGQDDQQVQRGQAGPDLDEPLEEQVQPAAEVALDRPRRDANC